MPVIHPLDTLQGYRLGSRQATTELQDAPAIHVEFDVLRLVQDIRDRPGQAVLLTGTAGDGKTYMARCLAEALKVDWAEVKAAQPAGGYDREGVFMDLDLSAGKLSDERVRHLHQTLGQPGRLTLACANEGKLDELEARLKVLGLAIPDSVLRLNLSERALVSPAAWAKVINSVVNGRLWDAWQPAPDEPLAWNRAWLQDSAIAERLRCYLLLPYLLGEPITIREVLSCLAYALGGGLSAEQAQNLAPTDGIRYYLFNTAFGEPDGYEHDGQAAPTEKLLWWLFRFDPADQASPEVDLRLLVELNKLDVEPPPDLLRIWHEDLVVRADEKSDTAYRKRLSRFMRYARRWYALASPAGFEAYFPFKHLTDYLASLSASTPNALEQLTPKLVLGLNQLLSGGQVDDDLDLSVFYLPSETSEPDLAIYSADVKVQASDLNVQTDQVSDPRTDAYLERFPRRLYLHYRPMPALRLPVSLLLYDVLLSAASPTGTFPFTLWAKERGTVLRFMNSLAGAVGGPPNRIRFSVRHDRDQILNLDYRPNDRQLKVS